MTIDKIRVIGAGAMGRGIAQVAVAAGYSVELTDASDEAVTAALEFGHCQLEVMWTFC